VESPPVYLNADLSATARTLTPPLRKLSSLQPGQFRRAYTLRATRLPFLPGVSISMPLVSWLSFPDA